MLEFNRQFDIILEDIIQSVTPEELKERQEKYSKMRIKMIFNDLFKKGIMVKNPYGSYDVDGDIDIYDLNLRSLKDIPYVLNKVNGYFHCTNNQLTSLEGCPREVNGSFYCSNNLLTSLEGCPKEINGDFYCSNNNLTSLVGCPKIVDGRFSCYNNSIKFTVEDVRKYCKVGEYIFA